MEPIVSPWFVYLLGVVDGANTFINTFVVIAIIVFVIITILHGVWMAEENEKDKRELGSFLGIVRKPVIISFCVFVLLAIFFPTKNMLIGMYAANEITYDRVGQAAEITKNLKDELKKDMLDIINSIGGK